MDALVQQASLSAIEVSDSVRRGLNSLDELDGLVASLQDSIGTGTAEAQKSLNEARKLLGESAVEVEKQVTQLHNGLDEFDRNLQDLQRRSNEELLRIGQAHEAARQDTGQIRHDLAQQMKAHQTEVDTVLARINSMRSDLQTVVQTSVKSSLALGERFAAESQRVHKDITGLADSQASFHQRLQRAHAGFQQSAGKAHALVGSIPEDFQTHVAQQVVAANSGVTNLLGEGGALLDIRKNAEQLFTILEKASATVKEARTFTDQSLASPIRKINEGLTKMQPILAVLHTLKTLGLV